MAGPRPEPINLGAEAAQARKRAEPSQARRRQFDCLYEQMQLDYTMC